MKNLIALIALLMLSACSIFSSKGDEIIFDTVLGPETKDQIKPLPATLEGDSDHAVYTSTQKKGKGMESEDGTGQR